MNTIIATDIAPKQRMDTTANSMRIDKRMILSTFRMSINPPKRDAMGRVILFAKYIASTSKPNINTHDTNFMLIPEVREFLCF